MPRPKGSKNANTQIKSDLFDKAPILPSITATKFAEDMTEPIKKGSLNLSANEICYIICQASKNNVSRLKMGDISISFSHGSQSQGDQPKAFGAANGVMPIATGHEIMQHTSDYYRQLQEDFEESNMMINDPVAYEQREIDKERRRSGLSEKDHNSGFKSAL